MNGTRQGCPLLPLIFAMVMESLAQSICSAPQVTGITIGDTEHKIGLYADDVIIALTNSKQSLIGIQHIIDQFSAVSL